MRIKVRLGDVIWGRRGRPGECMVARAIHRQMPELGRFDVRVSWGAVSLTREGHLQNFQLPAVVSNKIAAFDWHRWVWPFELQLPLEEHAPAKAYKPAMAAVHVAAKAETAIAVPVLA